MLKTKEELIDLVYEEAGRLARSMSSRSHLLTDTGRRLCQYVIMPGANDLAKAIMDETEEMLEYEKNPKD